MWISGGGKLHDVTMNHTHILSDHVVDVDVDGEGGEGGGRRGVTLVRYG